MNNIYKSKIFWIGLVIMLILGILIGKSGESNEVVDNHEHSQDETGLWTCSMHPQIKLDKPGQCPICFMDLISLVKSGNSENENQISISEAAAKLVEIQTSKVVRREAHHEIDLAGKIQLNEKKTITISADVNGRIEKMFVDFVGEKINPGDKLYEIYSPELYTAQEELIQQKKMVEQSQSESNLKALAAIRDKLELLGLTSDQVHKIKDSRKANETIVIYAKSGGTVLIKSKNKGDYVNVGNPIYEISDLSELWLQLDAYEKDLVYLTKNQQIDFTVKSLPGEKFKGTIEFVDPVINPQTQSARVRVVADNSVGKLKPGSFVNAQLKVVMDKDGALVKNKLNSYEQLPLLIPESAPLLTGKRAIVYVKVDNSEKVTFESREVQLGPKVGDNYIVLAGLKEGEEVVTKGNFKIDSAMQLEGKPSMMSVQDEKAQETENNLDAFIPLFNEYFSLQEALAGDDFSISKMHYRNLFDKLNAFKIGHSKMEHEKMLKWMAVKRNLLDNQKTAFVDIEALRTNFEILSDNLIDLAKTFGNVGDLTFNEAFCPMAFGNKGAYWLQKGDKVFNPYFGAKMLHCGSIKTKFNPEK